MPHRSPTPPLHPPCRRTHNAPQNSDEGKAYTDLARRVDEAITFMGACGVDMHSAVLRETEFYVSHEVCGVCGMRVCGWWCVCVLGGGGPPAHLEVLEGTLLQGVGRAVR